MNKPKKKERTIEDQLAHFTDQILEGIPEEDQGSAEPDPELRVLQQTALRLKDALPPDGPNEETIHRMRQNIVRQWSQPEESRREPFWQRVFPPRQKAQQKWQSRLRRQHVSQRIYLAAASLLLLVSIVLLQKVSSVQPAASGHSGSASLLIACSGLILFALWVIRRRR